MKKCGIQRAIAIGVLALPLLCGTPAMAVAQEAVQPYANTKVSGVWSPDSKYSYPEMGD